MDEKPLQTRQERHQKNNHTRTDKQNDSTNDRIGAHSDIKSKISRKKRRLNWAILIVLGLIIIVYLILFFL